MRGRCLNPVFPDPLLLARSMLCRRAVPYCAMPCRAVPSCVVPTTQVVGGCDNVVAIVPKGAKLDTVTESTDAVIMRAQDAAGALELRKRLTASANQMAAVAGLLDVSVCGGGVEGCVGRS